MSNFFGNGITANTFSDIVGGRKTAGLCWSEIGNEDVCVAGLGWSTTEPSLDESAVKSTTVRPELSLAAFWPPGVE